MSERPDIKEHIQKLVANGRIVTKALILVETAGPDMERMLTMYVTEETPLWDVVGMMEVVQKDLCAMFSGLEWNDEGNEDGEI